jgi:Protein of unknown function (DUF3017)
MANRPANAGANRAGPQQGPAAAPPPVHHQDFPRRSRQSRRSQRSQHTRRSRRSAKPPNPATAALAWLPYLIVLAGAVTGLFVAWRGSRYAGQGAAVVGGALLVAAVARLALPPRYAGLLVSRSKVQDVAGFAVLGAAVLVVAVSLP